MPRLGSGPGEMEPWPRVREAGVAGKTRRFVPRRNPDPRTATATHHVAGDAVRRCDRDPVAAGIENDVTEEARPHPGPKIHSVCTRLSDEVPAHERVSTAMGSALAPYRDPRPTAALDPV